jgi:hypothetical protein
MKNVSRDSRRLSVVEPETTIAETARPTPSLVEEKRPVTSVPVRKPARHEFVRVYGDPNYRLSPVGLAKLKEDGESYLFLEPDLSPEIAATRYTMYLAINRQGVPFVWPVRLPIPEGKHNHWYRRAAEAAELAMTRWVRLQPNPSLGTYEIFILGESPEPHWPDFSDDPFDIAFPPDRVVLGPGHLRRLLAAA